MGNKDEMVPYSIPFMRPSESWKDLLCKYASFKDKNIPLLRIIEDSLSKQLEPEFFIVAYLRKHTNYVYNIREESIVNNWEIYDLFFGPIENLPMLINDENTWVKGIVKWRLTTGV